MTLGDIIALGGGFKESASESYIEVTRRLSYEEASIYGAKNSHLYQFSVPRSLALNSQDANFELKPFDQVYVRKAPGFVEGGLVTLSGEILYSGQYGLSDKNEKLSEIIKRSGGLTPDAYAAGAMLTRRIELTARARRLREALKETEKGLEFSDLGFEVIGVDLAKAIQNPGSRDDIIMRDGDELVVPKKLFTINVQGEVLNPITMPYIEGRRLRYYINQGGGFGIRAKKNKAYVVYPNGTASATRNFFFFSNYPDIKPGSQIIVPQKPEREKMPASGWIAIGSGISSLSLTIVSIINATR
jgi:protein involved in polysaccharide export with SLBB domain